MTTHSISRVAGYVWCAVAVALLPSYGCGSAAGYILREPAVSKCKDAKLNGCEEIVEGVIAFADRRQAEGAASLRKGISQNVDDPDSLEQFATALKLLKAVPGAGGFVAYLDPAIKIMLEAAQEARKNPRPKKTTAEATASVATGGGSQARGGGVSKAPEVQVTSRSMLVSTHSKARACSPGNGWKVTPSDGARCAFVGGTGEVNTVALGGCRDTLMLGAGDPETPRWVIVSTPGAPVILNGVKLPVTDEDSLFLAQVPKSGPASQDINCVVTWSWTYTR